MNMNMNFNMNQSSLKRAANASAASASPAKRARHDSATPPSARISLESCDDHEPLPYNYCNQEESAGCGNVAKQPSSPIVAATSVAAARRPVILTFKAAHDKLARLQLLSTHTLYDLVSTLCRHTPIGYEGTEGPNDHLWHITYGNLKCKSDRAKQTRLEDLNLVKGSTITLVYDYGSTSTYPITVLGSWDANYGEDLTSFPRNAPNSNIPTLYQKDQPGINANLLDMSFFNLNDWIFHKSNDVDVHLFQAGRKKNYGFMDNKFTSMYLPAKPDNLANWLECFNQCASIKPAGLEEEGYTYYTWQSVVALPQSKVTPQLIKKYRSNEKRGFCDAPIVQDYRTSPSYRMGFNVNLDNAFPKMAALAGLRKDKRVPKGWVSFTRRGDKYTLAICKGNASESRKSKGSPKGLAFEGENQHEPVEEPLFQISDGVEIRGLQDLFCVVEGLLRTL
eukprot:CAMPEP_0183714266 /NCGR_PEP_ID=MMETSP0737-20130205/8847_1 /TAXON_ID=385413 /ORGANISM="Thalassiosira miniscula, Strain CCMP1093" /LENGTH=449 /DNA_ID=CAMNT_0025943173 /DNA_START=99 /DNA_END=1448 /DNA_ORIENTATION=+